MKRRKAVTVVQTPKERKKRATKTSKSSEMSESNEMERHESKTKTTLLAEQICKEIKNIDEKYSKIDMNDWNLDEISEQLNRSDTECPVQLTSADDVEENENDHFACDEIYSSGEKDIKRYIATKWSRKVGSNTRLVTAIPQLTYDNIRWLIKVKILKDLKKIVNGKLSSFYHSNFTTHKKEMPAALIRKTMFSDDQFKYICGCLKGLFVRKRVYELNYTLHVLLPETLIRMVMFVKKVTYKDAQKLMDTHLFSKATPAGNPLE